MASTGISTEVRRRIAKGLGATALAPVITAAIQLGSVPLLLNAWGAAKYGDWILMSAIPSYLSLSDLGFGDASGTDMTLRVAAGDRPGALRTFQSSWVLLTGVSLLILLLAIPITWFLPWQSWLHLSSLSNREAAAVILSLAAYLVIGQQMGVLESGFRCDGNYATGSFWWNIMRFAEAAIATGAGLYTGSLLVTAVAYLVVRIVGTTAFGLLLFSKSPWLHLGMRHAQFSVIKGMVKPAVGFIAVPAGHALCNQGLTVIIGSLLNPAAVAAFSTLRTLTRVNFQITNVIATSLWPELSAAFGSNDIPLARKLHRRAYQFGLALAIVGGAALWFTGSFIYSLWTRHALVFDTACFHVLIIETILSSLWFTSSVVPMSTNGHSRISLIFVMASLVCLAAAWLVIPHFGVTGAALALLGLDTFMCWVVIRKALWLVQDNMRGLFSSLIGLNSDDKTADVNWGASLKLEPAVVEKDGQ